MRVDKDQLIKHKFWVFLGVFVILWIASVTILTLTSSVEQKRKAYEAAQKDVKGALDKRPKNEEFFKPWNEYEKIFADQKDKVWKQAWMLQKDMITWPSTVASPFKDRWLTSATFAEFLKRLGEESSNPNEWRTSRARFEYKETLYPKQFKDLEKEKPVTPVEMMGGVARIMQQVNWQQLPLIEEIWLAQEDFWVRRQLLGIVRSVLDATSRFERVALGEKETKPADSVALYRFRNPNWELDLIIEKPGRQAQISARSEIRNVHVGKRTLPLAHPRTNKGLVFRLHQGGETAAIDIEGEPLAWGKSTTLKKAKTFDSKIDLTKPFDVEEVLDWSTSPVRRIDALQLGWHSHRTANLPLKSNPVVAKADAKEVKDKPPATGTTPPPPGTPPSGGKLGKDKGSAGTDEMTPNQLQRTRYIHLTEQCRHMPIAMLLVVDQANIHDVLIAVANSPLRIQVTQVSLTHVHGIRPPGNDDNPSGVQPPKTGQPPGTPGSKFGGGGGGAKTVASFNEDDPNLVELAIYGIATLYERFPDNRTLPGEAQPGTAQPGTASNPAGGTAATPKAETPKDDKGKTETKKGETPKSETTPKDEKGKTETKKGETPKGETPKDEKGKPETKKGDTPKGDTPKDEKGKPETKKGDPPKGDTPKDGIPKDGASKGAAPGGKP